MVPRNIIIRVSRRTGGYNIIRYIAAGVPGGLVRVGGPRAYQDQFRGSKSHRVHARRDSFYA